RMPNTKSATMKRLLITGATGFVGRPALELLVRNGYELHAVARKRQPAHPGVQWHTWDLHDENSVPTLFADVKPTHMLHFAWYAEHRKYWTAPENVDWLEASLAMMRAFKHYGGHRIVVAGTCAEYAWDTNGFCTEGVTPLRPRTLYGNCKNALQASLSAYSREVGLSSAWGRIFFPYGPHEYPSRLVPSVIRSLLKGEVARCTSGEQIRDFIHVEA